MLNITLEKYLTPPSQLDEKFNVLEAEVIVDTVNLQDIASITIFFSFKLP